MEALGKGIRTIHFTGKKASLSGKAPKHMSLISQDLRNVINCMLISMKNILLILSNIKTCFLPKQVNIDYEM